jgi:hypothetical protein
MTDLEKKKGFLIFSKTLDYSDDDDDVYSTETTTCGLQNLSL